MSILKKRSYSLTIDENPVTDIHLYSHESVLGQLKVATPTHGFYTLRFYTENGRLADHLTDTLSVFYLYPSGGTLRDETMNIVLYDSAFDTYRGFIPPHN